MPVVFIVGPTGSGKSKLALMLARKLKAEIVSADSMQIYRGMDIGTAKPTKKEQRLVRHHLLNNLSCRAECSVFKYRQLAIQAIQKIAKAKHLPMVVGGSGLYVKALIDGLTPLPAKQTQYRKELEKMSAAELHEKLKKLDAHLAEKIHANNKKRIIRALEILQAPQAAPKKKMLTFSDYGFKPLIFGLNRDRAELYQRIEKRVDQMFDAGWVNEVKRLKKTGLSKTARYAIGYKEILEFLDGKKSFEEADVEIKKRTRHLAKKQMTWFGRESRVHWYSVSGEKYTSTLSHITKEIKSSLRATEGSEAISARGLLRRPTASSQ